MSHASNVDKLMHTPLSLITQAYRTYNAKAIAAAGKVEMANWLADAIERGLITIADVVNLNHSIGSVSGQQGQTRPAPTVSGGPVNNAVAIAVALEATTAVGAVANRAEALALSTQAQTVVLGADLAALGRTLHGDLSSVKVSLDQMHNKQDAQVNAAAVAVAVADAVAAAFKPFHSAVIAAGASAAVGAMVSARIVDCRTAESVFGVRVTDYKGQDVMVDLWDDASSPAIDDSFIWTEAILKSLLLAQDDGCNLWFGGEKGAGKSETARQFAARTGRGYTRINFHKYTSSEDYIGAVGLVNGATQFVKGDFLQAFTSPSTVILLDEVTNGAAGCLAPLNGFLEANSAVNWGGAVHRRAPGVLVFAADNTLGNGDDSGRYAGTGTMNSALVDRFAVIVPFTFLPRAVECEALQRHTGCSYALADHVVSALSNARAKVQTGDIVDAPSIRSAIGFIRALKRHSVADAWALCVASRQPSEGAAALQAIYVACIDHEFLTRNI